MTQASTIGARLSAPEVAATGGRFAGAMRAVRGLLLGPKYEAIIDDLETALHVSRRTAERIYAGQAVGTDATLATLTHETLGPALLEEILKRVPAERRLLVAKRLSEAADLASMEAAQETMARQVAEKRARR